MNSRILFPFSDPIKLFLILVVRAAHRTKLHSSLRLYKRVPRDIRAGICIRVSQSADATIGCTSKYLIAGSIIVDLPRCGEITPWPNLLAIDDPG